MSSSPRTGSWPTATGPRARRPAPPFSPATGGQHSDRSLLALYETPADPKAFDRYYREVHIPLLRQLRGLRRYSVSRDLTALHGAPYYLVTELEWDTMDELRAEPPLSRGRYTGADHDLGSSDLEFCTFGAPP